MTVSAPRGGTLVWFRRDLRDHDHTALAAALAGGGRVFCAFVFDRDILDQLPSRADRRVEFIHAAVVELDAALRRRGGGLIVVHDSARTAIPRLARALRVAAVRSNHDYEPAAIARDDVVRGALADAGIAFLTTKDQVVFERDEVLAAAGTPFSVFTPYRNAWLRRLTPAALAAHDCTAGSGALAPIPRTLALPVPSLEALGFAPTNLRALGVPTGMSGATALFRDFQDRIDAYRDARDYPAVKGPSYLSAHLRFGTTSIRMLAGYAHARSLAPGGEGAAAWLSELIWREFYAQILWHHPRVVDHAFRPEYDGLVFPGGADRLDAWRRGVTGYPIVDAAMRQLAGSGYMHNRLRMIAASFLVKDLLVDWRHGERHFADNLLDYDLASNNGGWQWAASTGCDAQPYFRIFNPVTQSRRFDPEGRFIRRYVPELAALDAREIHAPWLVAPAILRTKGIVIGHDYPAPVVDHAAMRQQALTLFGRGGRGGR